MIINSVKLTYWHLSALIECVKIVRLRLTFDLGSNCADKSIPYGDLQGFGVHNIMLGNP